MITLFIKFTKRILLIFFLIFFLFNITLGIKEPFPFMKVKYIFSKKNFNLLFNDQLPRINLPENIKKNIKNYSKSSFFEKIQYATYLSREIQSYSKGSKIKTEKNLFSISSEYKEICSELSKIFYGISINLNLPTRIIWLSNHTLIEIWNGNKWIAIDPYSNLYFTDKKNNFLDIVEILNNFSEVKFVKILEVKSDKDIIYDFYESKDFKKIFEIFKNNKLIFQVKDDQIFSFHLLTSKLKRILYSFIFPFDN